ncbi:MAG: hypothetical protein ABIQ88_18390 [Chitinophagaceae bacterium]
MKANSTQLEILILTGTSFAANQFSDKNEANNKPGRTEKDILTEACWNGLLPSLLPEICEQIPAGKKIYLWEIKEADAFIELEMGELQEDKDKYFSINPYAFIPEQPLS